MEVMNCLIVWQREVRAEQNFARWGKREVYFFYVNPFLEGWVGRDGGLVEKRKVV